jgi:hypothetical protein
MGTPLSGGSDPVPSDAQEVTPDMALRYERGRWPSWQLRWEWWGQAWIPAELRNSAEPDPRPILEGTVDGDAYRAEREAWEAARLQWLEDGCPTP